MSPFLPRLCSRSHSHTHTHSLAVRHTLAQSRHAHPLTPSPSLSPCRATPAAAPATRLTHPHPSSSHASLHSRVSLSRHSRMNQSPLPSCLIRLECKTRTPARALVQERRSGTESWGEREKSAGDEEEEEAQVLPDSCLSSVVCSPLHPMPSHRVSRSPS